MTAEQAKRTKAMMEEYSKGEAVTIEKQGSCLYVFCSEIGSLRIFAKYNSNGSVHSPKARVGYSANLETHYFSLGI